MIIVSLLKSKRVNVIIKKNTLGKACTIEVLLCMLFFHLEVKMITSLLSFPTRGRWGDAKYKGNCSGFIIKSLLEHYKPKSFLEVFAGGGTGFEVANELGYVDSVHIDLNPRWGGWNALIDEVPVKSDFIFSHPPYFNMIEYSGNVWGEKHKDDLSHSNSYDDFIKKLDFVNNKLFESLLPNGRMAILIGDLRKNGVYYSIIKDMKYYGALEAHIIKAQYNCESFRKQYKSKFIPITHEHILIFRR